MYKFRQYKLGWLNIYVANPVVGAIWQKQFAPGVTPQNQFSLNVYTLGRFKITTEANDFSQVLGVGNSSLDIQLDEFPSDGLVFETPIEGPACRLCLSVEGGGKWSRVRKVVTSGEMVELTDGQIALVVPQTGWNGDGAPDVRAGVSFAVERDSFVFVMQRQIAETNT
jgi:hypothetical protein